LKGNDEEARKQTKHKGGKKPAETEERNQAKKPRKFQE
jgi:hypothetical protein